MTAAGNGDYNLSMRKIIFAFILFTVFVFLSCENGLMNETNKPTKYYVTVSYHSEGHTSGEVPVDDNKYEIFLTGYTYEESFDPPAKIEITILGNTGLLQKEGSVFLGWQARYYDKYKDENIDRAIDFTLPSSYFFWFYDVKKDYHIEIHAIWQ